MFEPISILSFTVALHGLSRPGSAVSVEASRVRARAESMMERVERSDALFGGKASVISALLNLSQSHAEMGWDGDDAAPVDGGAIALAAAFIRALPDDCNMPEVGVDPDGAVALDWMPSRRRMLSISFAGDSDRLAYAWIDGTDRGNAVAKFDRDLVPGRVLDAIRSITTTSERASIRAA